jgi:hypothetical protein
VHRDEARRMQVDKAEVASNKSQINGKRKGWPQRMKLQKLISLSLLTLSITGTALSAQAASFHWFSHRSSQPITKAANWMRDSSVAGNAVPVVRVSFHNWQFVPRYLRMDGTEFRLEPTSTTAFDVPVGTPVYIARSTRHHEAGTVLTQISSTDAGKTMPVD